MNLKKPRGDSKLKTLPEDQQRKVIEWIKAKRLDEVVKLVKAELGVETSRSSLSEFYTWFHMARRLEDYKSFADDLKGELSQIAGMDLAEDKVATFAQRAFELQCLKKDDAKTFFLMRMNGLAEKKLDLAERQQALAERKFMFSVADAVRKHAEKIRPIVDGAGSDDEKTEKLGQLIFEEDWK